MSMERNQSLSASTALSSSYAVLTLDGTPTGARSLADRASLGLAELALTSIAGGATKVTWYVCRDANRDQPLTDEIETDIVVGSTAGAGGCAATFDGALLVSTGGTIYIAAKLDAGTADAVARISWAV